MVTNSPSMYVLTFDEVQNMFGESGKDSGSMDMDEFLKNIWTSEETHGAMTKNSDCVENIGNLQQKQASLILPTTLGKRTLDLHGGFEDVNLVEEKPQAEQSTLGEMTLEVFLRKTEAVLENNQGLPNGGLFGDESNSLFGFKNHNQNQGFYQQEEDLTESKDDVKRQKFLPKQAATNLPSSLRLVHKDPQMGSPVNGVSITGKTDHLSYLFPSGNFDASPSPSSYAYDEGVVNERKRSATLEGVIERRRKRMIKNRESAARSRARKQSYTLKLEAEVAQLKELNHELQIKQEEIMESQKHIQVPEKMKLGSGGLSLRRTLTGPW